jgi:hypothetical protein
MSLQIQFEQLRGIGRAAYGQQELLLEWLSLVLSKSDFAGDGTRLKKLQARGGTRGGERVRGNSRISPMKSRNDHTSCLLSKFRLSTAPALLCAHCLS